ncbi:MAG: c-type cytochrome [Comamonadaceae bacterium]|nr:MAG: c-type cytochrome [Comamonadaceae bacterium]
MKHRLKIYAIGLPVMALLLAGLVWLLNVRDEPDLSVAAASPSALPAAADLVTRGEYLARAGNCMGCHTVRGGEPFAGGRAINTPFGTIFTSNLTSDPQHGIGQWTASEFWRAMHNGRSRDGRLLYPAFPYPNYTQVTREDSDAIHAYLKSVPPSAQANRPHELRWPYGTQPALAVWRALYFAPGTYESDKRKSLAWNRGAYLVQGLGHCSACHTPRNTLGASDEALTLSGGLIPMQNWYAPSLASAAEAGVADWDMQHIVGLLKTGTSARGAVTGPMAEVVLQSTQYLSVADLTAMATFLKELPQAELPAPAANVPVADRSSPGGRLYEKHCAQCHGGDGKGVEGAYPPLAGNRAVTMKATANLVQIVMNGGFAPATQGNPRPFGMPPFVLVLSDAEVAATLSYVRGAWGNSAAEVSELEVARFRGMSR